MLPQLISSTASSQSREPTFRGHRRNSYMPIDRAELVEFRARQRTFTNAYMRTSISNLASSVVILKLFDPRFYRIGCLYVTLGVTLAVISYARTYYSNEDFADHAVPPTAREPTYGTFDTIRELSAVVATTSSSRRTFGRPFVTAGWIVVMVTLVVLSVELSILYLVLHV